MSVESNENVKQDALNEDYEFKLEPESDRTVFPTAIFGSAVAPTPASSMSAGRVYRSSTQPVVSNREELEYRTQQARQNYNDSAGLYPRERHYPTLEAMLRLYKVFGYVAILCVFPYIAFRFLYLLFTTKEQHIQVFAEFSEFAVPVLFGCVALAASLFAASEGIKLAMDIQDNTLRIANNAGRKRLN